MIYLPIDSNSESLNDFKFPKAILYKIIKGNKFCASTIFKFQKKDKTYFHLQLNSFNGFGIDSKDLSHSFIDKNYQLERSMITRKKRILSEVAVLKDTEYKTSLLGGTLIAIKKTIDEKQKILEILTDEKNIMDFLSSFVLLSKKESSDKKLLQESYLFVISNNLFEVGCKYIGQEMYNFKGTTIYVTKYLLAKHLNFEDNNLAEFYIYKDSDGYCFPVKIRIFEKNEYVFIANKILK